MITDQIMHIISLFYFFLPAAIGNMAPVIVKNHFKYLAKPIDLGKKIGKNEILGSHKTFRGVIFACIFGILTIIIQSYIYGFEFFKNISLLNYQSYEYILLLGFLLGFGAIIGDMVKSFFKRRIGVKSGKPWMPFDQIDYSIGAMIFSWPLIRYSLADALLIMILFAALHITINHIAFYLKIRKEKW